ncbi:hypothetical protein AHAS_Ahas14G0011600 [Arachis hypogaea]
MKIMNSIIVVGLYYEFRSTFFIGLSYLFLLQARIMQEEAEKKLSATIRHYLFNPLVLPSFILVRLVNIYMFRCHNKLLFLTSDFGGRTSLSFVIKKKSSKNKESGEIEKHKFDVERISEMTRTEKKKDI